MQSSDILIVGAGPAGLAAAFWAQRREPAARVTLLEAQGRAGGWIYSERRDGYLCERGPQGLRPEAAFDELAAALDLGKDIVPASDRARRRWIGRAGRLLAVPSGPLAMLTTPLLSLRGKLRLLRERKVPRGDLHSESIAAFLDRRFGSEVVPLARAMMSGIFAGSADTLEVQSSLPMLAEAERDHGSVMVGMRRRPRKPRVHRPPLLTFRDGMQGLVRALATAIGGALQTTATVTRIERDGAGYRATLADDTVHTAPHLVLACPAHASARLLAPMAPELAHELAAIPFASVANVHLGLRADPRRRRDRGFGFLVEPSPASPLLGVLYCSDVFPDHAPAGHTLLRAMLCGALYPQAVDFDDATLATVARAEIERHWGRRIAPVFTHVTRVRRAIPQYDLGHADRMQRIDRCIRELPGLELRGNSYRGVAVTAQLGSANAPSPLARPATTFETT